MKDKKPSKQNTWLSALVMGFAMFSMFFGAGNLIFPPYLGMASGTRWLLGFLAFFLADAVLALVCLKVLVLKDGSLEKLFAPLGKIPARIMELSILLLLGPLVAVPRTGATSFDLSAQALLPGLSPWLFSFFFFGLTAFLAIRPAAVVDVIGKFLTPILLITLAVLCLKGIFSPIGVITATDASFRVVESGVASGYQTLDALGTPLMAIMVIQAAHIRGYTEKDRQTSLIGKAGLVAAAGLLLVYGGLCYLGATVSGVDVDFLSHSDLLEAITDMLLQQTGVILLAVIVLLACLTTSIGITSANAEALHRFFPKGFSSSALVLLICGAGFFISNLGTETIIRVAGPLLSLLYPIFLTQIFLALGEKHIRNPWINRGAALGALLMELPVFLTDLGLAGWTWISDIPLADVGLEWVLPSLLGGILGAVLSHVRKVRR